MAISTRLLSYSVQVGGRARAACAGPGSREHTRHESLGHVAASVRREAGNSGVCCVRCLEMTYIGEDLRLRTSHHLVRTSQDLSPIKVAVSALLPRLSHSWRAARCRRAGHSAVLTLIGEVSLISSRTGEVLTGEVLTGERSSRERWVLTGEVLTGEVLTHTGTQTRSCSVLD